MAKRKDDGADFAIKRAYEKWLEAGQPISGRDSGMRGGKAENRQKESARGGKQDLYGKKDAEASGRKGAFRQRDFEKRDEMEKSRKAAYDKRGGEGKFRKDAYDKRDGKERFRKDDYDKRDGKGEKQFSVGRELWNLPRIPKVDPNSDFPKCPVRKRCGGCSFIGLDYKWTLEYKEKYVAGILRPFVRLGGIVGMEDPFHYRNKVNSAFAYIKDRNGERTVCGIYEQGTHKVVPVTDCLLEDRRADAIIQDILKMTHDFKIKIYDEDSEYGLLRHVMVRTGHVTGQVMVVLVLSSPILPNKNAFVEALLEKHPEITTILISVNDEHTSMVLGRREIVLYGDGYIEDKLCGNTFRISPRSFYQVNSVQTEKMYRQAVKYANL
ncbi:MAG: 23S rRNA (uracil(1939)-C(5))-methyltransferase RlmD, partial [Lachnospiraceae bacterium]|nr:23S rRNA (uracil(1939)-C(5))-methyltransferase RlmD [Lachnospiraceae bacterium]